MTDRPVIAPVPILKTRGNRFPSFVQHSIEENGRVRDSSTSQISDSTVVPSSNDGHYRQSNAPPPFPMPNVASPTSPTVPGRSTIYSPTLREPTPRYSGKVPEGHVKSDSTSSTMSEQFNIMTTKPETRSRTKRRQFGIPQQKKTIVNDNYDYLNKYPEDEYGKEMDPNARVWHVYLDEATRLDFELVERWRENLDVLLVFAGLFSAVVTTFVVESASSLKPDYSEMTARLLFQSSLVQSSSDIGSTRDGAPVLTPDSKFDPEQADRWINCLWLLSLVIALATALFSVLCKQWLQHIIKSIPGDARTRAHVMQSRRDALMTWRVGAIVGLLPVLLHISLFIFFAGLAVYAIQLDHAIGTVIAVAVGLTLVICTVVTLLPLWHLHCPYVTPVITAAYTYTDPRLIRDWFRKIAYGIFGVAHKPSKPKWEKRPYRTIVRTANDAAAADPEKGSARALLWLYSVSSSNPYIREIVQHATAGLDEAFNRRADLRELAENLPRPAKPTLLDEAFAHNLEAWLESNEDTVTERYLRASQCLSPTEWSDRRAPQWESEDYSSHVTDLMLWHNPQLQNVWPQREHTTETLEVFHSFMRNQMRGTEVQKIRPFLWQEVLFRAGSLVMRFYQPRTQVKLWLKDTVIFLTNTIAFQPEPSEFRFAGPAESQLCNMREIPSEWLLYFVFCFIDGRAFTLDHKKAIHAFFNPAVKPSYILWLLSEVLIMEVPSTLLCDHESDACVILRAIRPLITYPLRNTHYFQERNRMKYYLEHLNRVGMHLRRSMTRSSVGPDRPLSIGRPSTHEYSQEILITLWELDLFYQSLSGFNLEGGEVLQPARSVDRNFIRGLTQPRMLEAAADRSTNILEQWFKSDRLDALNSFIESNVWCTVINQYHKVASARPAILRIALSFMESAVRLAQLNPSEINETQPSTRYLSHIMIPRNLGALCDLIFRRKYVTGGHWPKEFLDLIAATKNTNEHTWLDVVRSRISSVNSATPNKAMHMDVEHLKELLGFKEREEVIQWYYFRQADQDIPEEIRQFVSWVEPDGPDEAGSQPLARANFLDIHQCLSDTMELEYAAHFTGLDTGNVAHSIYPDSTTAGNAPSALSTTDNLPVFGSSRRTWGISLRPTSMMPQGWPWRLFGKGQSEDGGDTSTQSEHRADTNV